MQHDTKHFLMSLISPPPQYKSIISNEKQTFEWSDCLQSQVYTVTLQLRTEKLATHSGLILKCTHRNALKHS